MVPLDFMGIGGRIARVFGADDAAQYLLPGEQIVDVYPANAMVAEADVIAWIRTRHQASSRAEALALTGKALARGFDTSAVGGLLSLTSYRLLFVAHHLNTHTGRYSVFLPTIESVRNEATELSAQLTVTTHTMVFLFAVAQGDLVGRAVLAARDAVTGAQLEAMKQGARAHPDKVGAGLHAFWRPDAPGLDEAHLFERIEAVHASKHIEEVYGALNLAELLHPEWRERLRAELEPRQGG